MLSMCTTGKCLLSRYSSMEVKRRRAWCRLCRKWAVSWEATCKLPAGLVTAKWLEAVLTRKVHLRPKTLCSPPSTNYPESILAVWQPKHSLNLAWGPAFFLKARSVSIDPPYHTSPISLSKLKTSKTTVRSSTSRANTSASTPTSWSKFLPSQATSASPPSTRTAQSPWW